MSKSVYSIENLFLNYYKRLCYFAAQQTGDKQTAEDIVQEVFLKIWKNDIPFNNETQAKSYLYTSIKNACLNISRHQNVVNRYAESRGEPDKEEAKALENLVRSEVLGEIHAAIEKLPDGCRTVLKLSYFNSLKNEEIANHLGVSINTVKTQKARALQILREKLGAPAWLMLLLLIDH